MRRNTIAAALALCAVASGCSSNTHRSSAGVASSTNSADQPFLSAVSTLAIPRPDADLINQAHQFCDAVGHQADDTVLSSIASGLGVDGDGAITFANAALGNYCPTKHATFVAAATPTVSAVAPAPPPPTSGPPGATLTATDPDTGGTFDITVAKPLGLALQQGTVDRTLGVAVTIANVSGAPSFEAGYLGLAPTTDGTSADDGSLGFTDASTQLLSDTACKGMKPLSDAMADAGIIDAAGSNYDLSQLTASSITGCVTFTYDPPDAPNRVALYDDFPSGGSSDHPLLTWIITLPKPAMTPTPHITVTVYGNGSRSNVITYSIDTHISQATDARLPWSKQLDTGGDFYQVSAQDENGTSITCEILDVDGSVLDKQTSTGRYAIASCSASP